jgi:hypothetical protein
MIIADDDHKSFIPCTATLKRYRAAILEGDQASTTMAWLKWTRDEFSEHRDSPATCLTIHKTRQKEFYYGQDYKSPQYKLWISVHCHLIRGRSIREVIKMLTVLLDDRRTKQLPKQPPPSRPERLPSDAVPHPLLSQFEQVKSGKGCHLLPLDNSLASFGVFKGDVLFCLNRQPTDGDMVLLSLDDEWLLGHISISYATPERFTFRPLIEGERILLPAKHLRDVVAVVAKITAGQMIEGDECPMFSLDSPMPRVKRVGAA